MNPIWLEIRREDLLTEQLQAEQEGKDLRLFEPELTALLACEYPDQDRAGALLDSIQRLETRRGYGLLEPSDWESILRSLPALPVMTARADYAEGVHGAWVGRCAGCLLGKPVEGARRTDILRFLDETGQAPLRGYMRGDSEEARMRWAICGGGCFVNELSGGMPEDDDLNYTVMALDVLSRHGPGFTPRDVAMAWLDKLPILHTCTAERVAYRNFVDGVWPPASASHRNPYREWIGAQIRADLWGYVAPGDLLRAAELAWRDASVSHVKNGIYGAMWSAALNSAALCLSKLPEIVAAARKVVPVSRLSSALDLVSEWHAEGVGESEAVERVHGLWDEGQAHHWCHVIPNAMIVQLALLWGEGDFTRSISLAVSAGFDTDCNGATVGSVLGAMLGVAAVPQEWQAPLQDTLHTGVHGYHRRGISELARQAADLRTC